MKTLNKLLILLMLAVPFVGCDDDDDDIAVSKVELNKTALTLEVDGSEKLTATVSPSDATDKTVTWSSSNETVATVASDGTVTAKAEGNAVITAKAGDKTAPCTVTVTSVDNAQTIVGDYLGTVTGMGGLFEAKNVTIALTHSKKNEVLINTIITISADFSVPVIDMSSPVGIKDDEYTIDGKTSVPLEGGASLEVTVTGTIDKDGKMDVAISAGSFGTFNFQGVKQ